MAENFRPIVKGTVMPPGKFGLPNIVPVGGRQAGGNLQNVGGSSYWWNLGSEQELGIHDIARRSIGYTNAASITPHAVNETMAEGYGVSIQELRDITNRVKATQEPGAIVFAKIPTSEGKLYTGGGESMGEAIQVGRSVVPETTMSIPEGIRFTPGGPIRN
jgi:hypothetical protein